jgi:aspartate-semialdehyde dehydrogenase
MEPQKILGSISVPQSGEAEFVPAAFKVSAQCNRVHVIDGHMECVSIKLKKATSVEAVEACLRNWQSEGEGTTRHTRGWTRQRRRGSTTHYLITRRWHVVVSCAAQTLKLPSAPKQVSRCSDKRAACDTRTDDEAEITCCCMHSSLCVVFRLVCWSAPPLSLHPLLQPIFLHSLDHRPQPRLDRDRGGGFVVTVGRVRECPLLDFKFTLCSHNTVLGAAGGSILNAELAYAKGFI